jgi:hypothetical protein
MHQQNTAIYPLAGCLRQPAGDYNLHPGGRLVDEAHLPTPHDSQVSTAHELDDETAEWIDLIQRAEKDSSEIEACWKYAATYALQHERLIDYLLKQSTEGWNAKLYFRSRLTLDDVVKRTTQVLVESRHNTLQRFKTNQPIRLKSHLKYAAREAFQTLMKEVFIEYHPPGKQARVVLVDNGDEDHSSKPLDRLCATSFEHSAADPASDQYWHQAVMHQRAPLLATNMDEDEKDAYKQMLAFLIVVEAGNSIQLRISGDKQDVRQERHQTGKAELQHLITAMKHRYLDFIQGSTHERYMSLLRTDVFKLCRAAGLDPHRCEGFLDYVEDKLPLGHKSNTLNVQFNRLVVRAITQHTLRCTHGEAEVTPASRDATGLKG